MKTLDTNIKNLFEYQVLKQLIEDNLLSFAGGQVSSYNAITLAERCFEIAAMQGYGNFGSIYRSQLINAFCEILTAYKDICRRYEDLKSRYPEERFLNMGGLGQYKFYRDGTNGTILKISTEVRAGINCIIPDRPEYENIISVSFYVLDKSNYNYRNIELDEWKPQNNLLAWKDIVQGNALLNFILTLSRSAAIPMRSVNQCSTRQMVKPIPPPPHPAPPPCPYPPAPVPPPYPYPVPPAPIPPPPPPHDCIIKREIIAERTVGGINKGDIIPVGMTFTQVVEWLLHGQEDEEVAPTITLSASNKILALRITDTGTGTPRSIKFFQQGVETALFTYEYAEGQAVYTFSVDPPVGTTEYYGVLNYMTSKGELKDLESNVVSITVEPLETPEYVYFGGIAAGGTTPTVEDVIAFDKTRITDSGLESGIRILVPTYHKKMVIAVPATYVREHKTQAGVRIPPQLINGEDEVTPENWPSTDPIAMTLDGIDCLAYVWEPPYMSADISLIMTKNSSWKTN